jgi:ribosomal protein S18 acetylase RimI-like enzyme
MSPQQEILDNAPWFALTNQHARFAIGSGRARRYRKDISVFAGVEANDVDAYSQLATLFETNELTGAVGPDVAFGDEWEDVGSFPLMQMVYAGPPISDPPNSEVKELTDADVPAMLALVELTKPGPFLVRTIELGRYLAIWQDGRLAAMAGERMHVPGFQEVSAVCTHPEYQRRGYARILVKEIVRGMLRRGDTPFLHVDLKNAGAIALYESLGFRKRAEFAIIGLRRK